MAAYRNVIKISRNCSTWTAKHCRPSALSTKFLADYYDFFPRLIDKTIQQTQYMEHPDMKNLLSKIGKYYTRYPISSEAMIYAYELLEKRENINDEKLHRAYCVACAMELCQNCFYFQDDVYDKGVTRAGKKCWHLLPESSPLVINDCRIFRCLVDEILRQNVKEPIYSQIIHAFHDNWFTTELGQYVDLTLPKIKGYDHFTIDNYQKLMKLKASFFGLVHPVHVALSLCNKGDEATIEFVTNFLFDFGMLLQIHNDFTDFLDCDESMSKKSNNDIQNRRCTWNAVTALQLINNDDREIFEECYGSSDPQKVKQIMLLYEKIDLPKLFRQYESSFYKNFLEKIKGLSPDTTPSPEFFMAILKFYQSFLSNTSRYFYI